MALNATMYRFGMDLSDLNRHVYQSLSVHVALHPSETISRMCARVLAYAVCYEEGLAFTKGLSSDEEPDLWQHNYSGEIEHWIELGKPEPKRLRKALGRSKRVTVFCYGGQDAETWLASIVKDNAVRNQITVFRFDVAAIDAFASLIQRTLQLSIMIQDDTLDLTVDGNMLSYKLERLMEPA